MPLYGSSHLRLAKWPDNPDRLSWISRDALNLSFVLGNWGYKEEAVHLDQIWVKTVLTIVFCSIGFRNASVCHFVIVELIVTSGCARNLICDFTARLMILVDDCLLHPVCGLGRDTCVNELVDTLYARRTRMYKSLVLTGYGSP
jgi:hypothetical protein